MALGSLAVLWRFKVPEPILVTGAGMVSVIVWPLVKEAQMRLVTREKAGVGRIACSCLVGQGARDHG